MGWAPLPVSPGFYPKWVSPAILQLCSCRLYDLPVLPKVLMFGTIKAAVEAGGTGGALVLSGLGFRHHGSLVASMLSGFWGAISSPKMQLPTPKQLHPH